MQEWLNWHAWKACEPLKGSAGSNPALSAEKTANYQRVLRCFLFITGQIVPIYACLEPCTKYTQKPDSRK